MLLCLQPRTSQDGAFSSHFSKRTHKGYPQKIVCNAQLGNRWAQRGGEGMLLEASMLVLRSFVFGYGRVQAVAQAFVAHFIVRQLFAVQDA